jgi:site-specific recombinase XerD
MNNLTTRKREFTFDSEILSTWGKVEDNYKFHIKNFLSYARETTADSGIELIEDYFKSLNDSGLSASSVCCRRFAIKNRLRASMEGYGEAARAAMEYSLEKIDKKIKAPGRSRQSIGADKVINEKEYTLLMEKARSDRQRRFIEFLYTTGSRVSEMIGVLLPDCTIKNNTVTVRLKGKGNIKMDYKSFA